MKSMRALIIVGQFIIILILYFFGYTQRIENEALNEALMKAKKLAEENRIEAENLKVAADSSAQEAMRQAAEAHRQMQLCIESQKKR